MKETKKVRIHQEYKAQKSYEPTWDSDEICTIAESGRALTWYNENKNDNDASKYLKCDASLARRHITYAWVERMISRGFKFNEKSMETYYEMREAFQAELQELRSQAAKKTKGSTNVVSIQERVQQKVDEFIGELEGMVDEYGIRGNAKECNPYQWMVDNDVKPMHASKIIEHFRKSVQEVVIAEEGSDPEISEGYEGYTKGRLRNIIFLIGKIIKDAERISDNQKVARKPRKKKAVPVEKKVAGLKFKERDDAFKIQSVNPVKIPGAMQLWVFNTKTRKLGVYIAEDTVGLVVKGSSIQNYKYTESICKTLRKPNDMLPKVLSAGKVALRKLMGEINSKGAEMNGRINKDIVLLRVE